MISINTNVAAINAQRNLGQTQTRLESNFGRLSTGLRINRSADDAAGLAISERLKSQVRSLAQAERNANDGISLLQTAEGAMNEVSGIITRIRELAVQSANGTLGTTDRSYIDNEKTALLAEIDRIAASTDFNGTQLLNGGGAGVSFTFQIGSHGTAADRITVAITDMTTGTLAAGGLGALDLTTQAGSQTALATLDTAIDDVSTARANLGAAQNRLTITIANLGNARENLSAANSRIRDVDVAAETAEMTRNNILSQSGIAVLAQANQMPTMALKLLQG
ncbi:MAG: flagellin FliC [Sandaracinaceae bacterium]|nr:flagellin FliC [Sandaracinaceae bacterium]